MITLAVRDLEEWFACADPWIRSKAADEGVGALVCAPRAQYERVYVPFDGGLPRVYAVVTVEGGVSDALL